MLVLASQTQDTRQSQSTATARLQAMGGVDSVCKFDIGIGQQRPSTHVIGSARGNRYSYRKHRPSQHDGDGRRWLLQGYLFNEVMTRAGIRSINRKCFGAVQGGRYIVDMLVATTKAYILQGFAVLEYYASIHPL